MMISRTRTIHLLALLVGLAIATTAAAQADWQADLANEALIMEDCEVSFLTQVIERTIGGRSVVLVKVHCVDGRTFDASRDDAYAAFDFRICEPEDEPAAC
jgi:hypothetical protein